MPFPDYQDDMESQLASYLGENLSTFSSNENPTVSAPVDALEESAYDTNGHFTWDDFLKEEGIETNSPPPSTWEWNPTEADFYKNEIVAPPTVNEPSSREPAQSSRQEEEAHTNVESDNTIEPAITTPSMPEPEAEQNPDIADDESVFGGDTSNENELTVPDNAHNLSTEVPTPSEQPSKTPEPGQQEDIDISDDDSLFGGSTSDDVEVQKSDEEHGSETTVQETNSTPEIVADTPQHSDSTASAPITPGADLNNVNADNDNDSLFGGADDSGLGNGFQPPENESPTGDNAPNGTPTDDIDDLFGSEFGADFEAELAAELEAELKKDSVNAVAPAVPKHTGLHLPRPPRKVANPQGLHLPDPPRAIANPQGLHLPAPPRVVARSQELNLPVPAPVVANPHGLHLLIPTPVTVVQQSGVDTSAQEETGDQEDEASTKRRRVRASRIPRSDMSRPKGRGQAGKVLTQFSGPAPSKLPDTAPSSSSGADDTAERVTRLPRWAFGKYTSFGKPVAGSRYRKPNNSVQNPIPVEDEQESVENTNELANTQPQDIAQSETKMVGDIDLTSDTRNDLAVENSVRQSQNPILNNGEDSTRPYENFQIPASGNEMKFTYGDDPLPNSPNKLSFPPVMDNAVPAPELQAYQSHSSAALDIVPPVTPQYRVPPGSRMEDFSLYRQVPLTNSYNGHPVQVPDVHGTGAFVHQSPYTIEQTGAQSFQPAIQQMQTGNYGQGNVYGLGGDIVLDNSAEIGGRNSSGLDNSRTKKRPSHERAEYGDPRISMTYGEFKQIFPQEQTRGCFEVAIQNERAADVAIVARGGIPPQRPTIRKSIICTWSQAQHLNRIRAANGEKLFEPKPNAHKRPEAFKESLRRRRQERGEISESEESDMEPEAKRLRLALESVQNASSHVGQHSEQTSEMHPTQPSHPQVSAAVSHPLPDHGIPRGPHSQNMGQASSMHIHQPVAQSTKRKMVPEQWESFEFTEQEMGPTAKRPRIAAPSSQNTKPINNQSMAKQFQDYVSERQSEYLKLRVPELKQLCKTRDVKHDNVNLLSKGGLVGVLVGQDVSRHPVYSQMHHQAQARAATGREHSIPGVGRMGAMNPPPVAVNRGQQQLRVPNGWGIRQDLSRPDIGPVHGIGLNYHQRSPSQFPHTGDHRAPGPGPTPMRSRNSALPVTNSGLIGALSHGYLNSVNVSRAQRLYTTGNSSGMTNNGGQPLISTRNPPNVSQGYQGSMTNPGRAASYAQSRLPVIIQHNGYNNSSIQHNLNGGRNNHTSANAQVPAYGIADGFGTGIYQPAVDDRRRKPRIVGQDAPSRVSRGNQRSLPQPVVNVPQPAMNNTARQYTSTQ
ncbi:hypothetical protein BPAE_0091g00270 [Botrytis paeoniae]|uniref:Uncharacterized protein n=1 Tax=Botrytis paeoniae TaxID=278948 RepID=A0A4Z1FPL3_9HELO|nr:hypothetical protein BPAE_0091g00270 [Botrytis paeoniae]